LAILFSGGGYIDESSGVVLIPSQSYDAKKYEIFGEAGLSLGLRVLDFLLLYGSGSARYTYFDGDYTTTPQGPTGPGSPVDLPFSGNVLSYNGNAGVELGIPALSLRLEYGYGQHQSGNMNAGAFYWGAEAELAFDLAKAEDPPPAATGPAKPLPKPPRVKAKTARHPNEDSASSTDSADSDEDDSP
jgi:hypothetical protein